MDDCANGCPDIPEPRQLEIQEIPTQAPLQLAQPVSRLVPDTSSSTTTRRKVASGGARRGQGRPARPQQGGEANEARGQARPLAEGSDEPRGRPRGGEREEPVGTLERYSHKNEDGSFTFGYVSADGSFREETRGADCITRGKYGYIDPDGIKREYTYTSGLPCQVGGEEGTDLQALDGNSEGNNNNFDPVDPSERFRQTQNVQLGESEIPESNKRQRVNRPFVARPAEPAPEQLPAQAVFPAAPVQQRRPTPQQGSALQNLFTIADNGGQAAQPTAAASFPTLAPTIRTTALQQQTPRPTARPSVVAPANPGTFDFDTELEGFTLNRPSLTFEQSRGANQQQPATTGSQFQSQLVFDPQSGTFQTELHQNIPGHGELSLKDSAAPFGAAATTAAPFTTLNDFTLTTFGESRATAQPTTAFTPRPTPAASVATTIFGTRPTPAAPSPTPTPARAVLPAGTIKLDFEPLNIPQATQLPSSLAPTTVGRTAAPTPASSFAPSTAGSPLPTTFTASSPTPSGAPPTTPPTNTFFVFQPFAQQGNGAPVPAPSPRPISEPFPAQFNPNAFQIRPATGQATSPAAPQAALPVPQGAAPQAVPLPQGVPQAFQPRPVQQSFPTSAAAPAPNAIQLQQQQPAVGGAASPAIQFGFQPVQQQQPQQQQQQNKQAPFTAFRSGTPPQLQQSGAFQQQPAAFQQQPAAFQQQPAAFQQQPQQLGIPPQLQQQQQQQQPAAGNPFAQFDSRFAPRPQAQAPQAFAGGQFAGGQFAGQQLQFVPQAQQLRPAQFTPGQQQQQQPGFSVFRGA